MTVSFYYVRALCVWSLCLGHFQFQPVFLRKAFTNHHHPLLLAMGYTLGNTLGLSHYQYITVGKQLYIYISLIIEKGLH